MFFYCPASCLTGKIYLSFFSYTGRKLRRYRINIGQSIVELEQITMQRFYIFTTLLLSFVINCFPEIIVTGKVVGADGYPMKMANVSLIQLPDYKSIETITAADDGTYRIALQTNGIWMLKFSGVFHRDQWVTILTDKSQTISLSVNLAPYNYVKDMSDVKVNGSFNRWYILNSIPMQKQQDGTFSATIESADDSISYKLLNVKVGDAIEGTQAEKFTYKDGSSYASVISVRNGKVDITFDPKELPIVPASAHFTFGNAENRTIIFSQLNDEYRKHQEERQKRFMDIMQARKNIASFVYDWLPFQSFLNEKLEGVTDSILRREGKLLELSAAILEKKIDKQFYTATLKEITPASLVWILNPHAMYYALVHSDYTDEQKEVYIQNVISHNKEKRVCASLLFDEFHVAKYSEQGEKSSRYYDLLVSRFGDTPEALDIQRKFPHEIDLMLGRPIPAFAAEAIDDSTKIYTNDSFKGKYFLIDFWSAKDAQSVAEMKVLNNVYKKYKSKSFDILSFSVDSLRQNVIGFQKAKWKMPWKNVFLGAALENSIVSSFQVVTIPKRFLVDPGGNLAAMGDDLMGNKLMKTLSKIFHK
jgi:hypothetical protein